MKKRIFSNGLVVISRARAVEFENREGKKEKESKFGYGFTPMEFVEFVAYMEQIASESWSGIEPREAHSMSSDYDEYYDKKYDANGYLELGEFMIIVTAPYWSTDTLYKFSKPKMQSFMYDLRKKIGRVY